VHWPERKLPWRCSIRRIQAKSFERIAWRHGRLTVTEAAKGLDVSRGHLSDLLNGHSGISAEMALRLERELVADETKSIMIYGQAKQRPDISKVKKVFDTGADHNEANEAGI